MGTIWCDPMGVGVGCAGVIAPDLSATLAPIAAISTSQINTPGAAVADFVVPLEAAPGVDLGGGGGGTFVFDPLAGAPTAGAYGYLDPSVTAPAPVDTTAPVLDPTLAAAIGLDPALSAPLTSIAANAPTVYGLDTAGQPQTTFTTTVTLAAPTTSVFDPSLLPVLPTTSPSPTTGIFPAPAPTSYTPPATPTSISVFDPSLLPQIPSPNVTPYSGILPPVAPLPASAAPSLLSRIANAIKQATGGGGGGGGGTPGTGGAAKPGTAGTTAKPAQANVAGGPGLLWIVLIGAVIYLVARKDGA